MICIESHTSVWQPASVSEEDVKLINKVSLEPLKAEQVYTFHAKVIDSEPTANGRVWTPEFLQENASRFIGVPLSINHSAQDALMGYGQTYAAEYADGAIQAKFYMPLTNERNRMLAEALQKEIASGNSRRVSLQAWAPKAETRGGLSYLYPSESDRIMEISLLTSDKVPGCSTCMIGECHEAAEGEADIQSEALREFANEQWSELKAEYLRMSAFAFGTGIHKPAYQAVAESVHPQTLKRLVADLKKTVAERSSGKQETSNPNRMQQLVDAINKQREEREV